MTKRGFTLFEILLVMSILGIIGTVSVVFSVRLLRSNDLNIAVRHALNNIRIAQTRAQLASGSNSWGLYITSGSMTLFRGSSYVTRDQTQDAVTEFSQRITVSGLQEVTFDVMSGTPSQSGLITFTHADITQPRYLFVNPLGLAEEVKSGELETIAVEDASLHQGAPSSRQGSTAILEVYPRNVGYNKRVAILMGLSHIPSSATVTQATLYAKQVQTYGSTRTIGVYRIIRSWNETETTWNNAASTTAWSTAGGDFVPTPTDTETLTWTGTLQWSSWDVTSDVQAMVSGSTTNSGWLLKDTSEDTSEAYWYFSSREGNAPPYLYLEYTLE